MQKKKNVLMSLMKEGNRANNAWNTNVFTTKMLQPKIILYIYILYGLQQEKRPNTLG